MSLGELVLVWACVQREFSEPSMVYMRILKRLIHLFAQVTEDSIERSTRSDPPAPQAGKPHPFQKQFRRVGGRSVLQTHIAKRFMVRGGGFVSLKEEKELRDLQLVPKGSQLATRCVSQFVALHVLKAIQITAAVLHRSDFPVFNFCIDAARVFKQQATQNEIFLDMQKFGRQTHRLLREHFNSITIVFQNMNILFRHASPSR